MSMPSWPNLSPPNSTMGLSPIRTMEPFDPNAPAFIPVPLVSSAASWQYGLPFLPPLPHHGNQGHLVPTRSYFGFEGMPHLLQPVPSVICPSTIKIDDSNKQSRIPSAPKPSPPASATTSIPAIVAHHIKPTTEERPFIPNGPVSEEMIARYPELEEWPDMSTFTFHDREPNSSVTCRDTQTAKELGVFTTGSFMVGDRILEDRSIMVIPVRVREKNLLRKFVQMPRIDQEKLMSLFSPHSTSDDTPLLHLQRLTKHNRVDLFGFDHESSKVTRSARALFPWVSKLNHSCSPNALVSMVETHARDTAQVHIVAMRDIEPGEELTISYVWNGIRPFAGQEERQRQLSEQFNFDCLCENCDVTHAKGKKNEEHRATLQQLEQSAEAFTNQGDLKKAFTCSKDALEIQLNNRNDFLQTIVRAYINVYKLAAAAKIIGVELNDSHPVESYLLRAEKLAQSYQSHWKTMVDYETTVEHLHTFAESFKHNIAKTKQKKT